MTDKHLGFGLKLVYNKKMAQKYESESFKILKFSFGKNVSTGVKILLHI